MTENGSALPGKTLTEARHYTLVCSFCGREQEDDGLILECAADHEPALLRTAYADLEFSPQEADAGLFRYRQWLPVRRVHPDVARTAVYRSHELAKALGLRNLWIAFNGYWPERGAFLETATFKEFEAHTVLGRLPQQTVILTAASSGNTGASFAWVCSQRRMPCLLIIGAKGLGRFAFREPLHPCVCLVVIDDGDYPDAIALADIMAQSPAFLLEGGVKNVGRRDGLATVLLSAFEEMRCLPAYYFQAVGSGTGAIAVHEAARRLRHSQLDMALPRLMLCQNLPFTPIYDAWRQGQRDLGTRSAERFRDAIRQVHADELTNWSPPYAVRGGVYDSLAESGGDVLVASNAAVQAARLMFRELEGIDVEPAAGVAVACLRDAAASGRIGRDETVLLNVTGGGRGRFGDDYSLIPAVPDLHVSRSTSWQETMEKVSMKMESEYLVRR